MPNSTQSLFVHFATGGDENHASFQGAKERVLGTLARPVTEDLALTWLGTMAMYQVGGEAWKHWNDGPLKRLGQHQDEEGGFSVEAGSDIRATALATLSLEARYRFARLMGR